MSIFPHSIYNRRAVVPFCPFRDTTVVHSRLVFVNAAVTRQTFAYPRHIQRRQFPRHLRHLAVGKLLAADVHRLPAVVVHRRGHVGISAVPSVREADDFQVQHLVVQGRDRGCGRCRHRSRESRRHQQDGQYRSADLTGYPPFVRKIFYFFHIPHVYFLVCIRDGTLA